MVAKPEVEISSTVALWDWLKANHSSNGAILVTYKAADPARYVSREEVLDALVAYGWIDGRRYKVDAARTAQLITPRRTGHWAASYKARADRLIAQGRMQPPGLALVEAAKKAGGWAETSAVDALVVPEDLAAALGPARANWDALAPSYRRNLLRWLDQAKRAETRLRRLDKIAASVSRGEKLPNF